MIPNHLSAAINARSVVLQNGGGMMLARRALRQIAARPEHSEDLLDEVVVREIDTS